MMKKISSVNFYSDHYYPLPLEIAIAELCSYDEIHHSSKDLKTEKKSLIKPGESDKIGLIPTNGSLFEPFI